MNKQPVGPLDPGPSTSGSVVPGSVAPYPAAPGPVLKPGSEGARRVPDAVPASDADRSDWDAYVATHAEADVLQSWAWGEAMREDGQSPVRLLVRAFDGRLMGVAQALVRPTSFSRTVLYAPHGPVWERESDLGPWILKSLLEGLRSAARRERGIVVKIDPAASRSGPDDADRVVAAMAEAGLQQARHDLQARTTRIVDLAGTAEDIAARWTSEARNLARRSVREGVSVDIDRTGSPTDIAAAYAALQETASQRGIRSHDQSFLEHLARELGPTAGWYLGIGRLDGRAIGSMVVARTGDRAAYLYGGMLHDIANRHANPGYGVMAAMMHALSADGVRWFDLWGVHDPLDPDANESWAGFSAFKRRFGGRELRHPGTFDLVVSPGWNLIREVRERARSRRPGAGNR